MHPVAQEFLRHFQQTENTEFAWDKTRFVIIDTEMTGLDPRVDRLVSIGAIGCIGFELTLDDAFEAYVRISHNTSAVHVHGITRELAESEGAPESEVLRNFLEFLRYGVIVGHHVRHDCTMISRACKRCFDMDALPNLVVDTMDLAIHLEQSGLLPRPLPDTEPDYSLDGLCGRFGLAPHDRHTATGDAFLTGQVFLKLLRRAHQGGLVKLGQVVGLYERGDPSSLFDA